MLEVSESTVCPYCREPDKFLPPGVPRILLSESDFHDPNRQDGGEPEPPACVTQHVQNSACSAA